jgi:hypothetical protein
VVGGAQQQQQAPTAYAPAAPVPPMNAGGNTTKYAATGKAPAANEAKVRREKSFF